MPRKSQIQGVANSKPTLKIDDAESTAKKKRVSELNETYLELRNRDMAACAQMREREAKRRSGDLLDRPEVEFLLGNALTVLRGQILRLPLLVVAELRGEDCNKVHAIRLRIEHALDSFLEEAAANLEKAADPRGIAALEAEEEGFNGQDSPEAARVKQDAIIRKKKIANAARRAKAKQ
jgi:hypothetical protein